MMNGMMAMMPFAGISHGRGQTPLHGKAADGTAGFSDALSALLQQAGGEQDAYAVKEELLSLFSGGGDELADDELLLLLQEASLDELANSIEELFGPLEEFIADLPLEESFLAEELLEPLAGLMADLPDHWSDDLQELFENEVSLGNLVEEFKIEGDPVRLLAIMAALTAKESAGFNGMQESSALQSLQKALSVYFPAMDQQEQARSLKELTAKLKEALSGIRDLSGDRMNQIQSRLEGQNVNTARFAELAYLNQLVSDKNKVQAVPAQSMILETTNSQMARFHQLTMPQGEIQPERPNQEQFVRQFQNLLSRSSFQQLSNGVQQLTLKLHPASLGRLDINIQHVNGVMMATLMTTTKAARDLIEGQLSQLRHAFTAQNIQVDKIEVTQQQNQQLLKDAQQNDAGKEEQGSEQSQTDSDHEDENEDVLDFSEFLEQTINTEA